MLSVRFLERFQFFTDIRYELCLTLKDLLGKSVSLIDSFHLLLELVHFIAEFGVQYLAACFTLCESEIDLLKDIEFLVIGIEDIPQLIYYLHTIGLAVCYCSDLLRVVYKLIDHGLQELLKSESASALNVIPK